MSNRNSFIAGILVSLAAVFFLLMLTGAISTKSNNYKSDMGLWGSTASAMHVACSADGRVVYVADESRVLCSKDYGGGWKIVMTSKTAEKDG